MNPIFAIEYSLVMLLKELLKRINGPLNVLVILFNHGESTMHFISLHFFVSGSICTCEKIIQNHLNIQCKFIIHIERTTADIITILYNLNSLQ